MAGNSWQDPVGGEPNIGKLHYLPRSATDHEVVTAVTPAAGWSAAVDCSSHIPVGSTAIELAVETQWQGNAGAILFHLYFGTATGVVPGRNYAFPRVVFSEYSPGTGVNMYDGKTVRVPVTTSRTFYYYYAVDVGVISAGYPDVWMDIIGYYS